MHSGNFIINSQDIHIVFVKSVIDLKSHKDVALSHDHLKTGEFGKKQKDRNIWMK